MRLSLIYFLDRDTSDETTDFLIYFGLLVSFLIDFTGAVLKLFDLEVILVQKKLKGVCHGFLARKSHWCFMAVFFH